MIELLVGVAGNLRIFHHTIFRECERVKGKRGIFDGENVVEGAKGSQSGASVNATSSKIFISHQIFSQ
jgi:hypothetical protein